jgi:hypothetical protein
MYSVFTICIGLLSVSLVVFCGLLLRANHHLVRLMCVDNERRSLMFHNVSNAGLVPDELSEEDLIADEEGYDGNRRSDINE